MVQTPGIGRQLGVAPVEKGRNDLHNYLLERYGIRGEALYMGVLEFIAITVNGLAAYRRRSGPR
ncbi:MAG: hypothetical protein WA990_04815 [Rubrobacteraceae bacterium]